MLVLCILINVATTIEILPTVLSLVQDLGASPGRDVKANANRQ